MGVDGIRWGETRAEKRTVPYNATLLCHDGPKVYGPKVSKSVQYKQEVNRMYKEYTTTEHEYAPYATIHY